MLGLTFEFFPQFRVLSRYPDRAGVEMAFTHHYATEGNKRCSRKAEFLRAKQGRDGNIAPRFQLAIRL